MPDNLILQYNEIVSEIFQYEQFKKQEFFLAIHPIEVTCNIFNEINLLKDILLKKNKTWLGVGLDSEVNTPTNQDEFNKRYTEKESNENPFFEIAMDNYPLNAFSDYLQKKHKNVDFSKLLKIHDEWTRASLLATISSFITLTSIIGILFGFIEKFSEIRKGIMIFINTSWENYISLCIEWQLGYGFLVLVIAFLLFFSLFILIYSKNKRMKVKRILEYVAIKQM